MKVYEEGALTSRGAVRSRAVAADGGGGGPEISVFLPVLNEEPNLRPLHAKLDASLASLGRTAEIIYVDDGSTDGSLEVLRDIAAEDPRVRVISLRRNYGQTAAMAAGIDAARGQILIPMDADLQNDPADIRNLLARLDEGYDVVSGWRKERQDKMVSRKIPSMIANKIISFIGGVKLHDYGCSLKAYRREFLKEVKLYGEMHRFIPIYASWVGARVTEIPVRHHARTMGKSKYGLSRTFKVMLDLMTIKFMASYHTKPIYVFGLFGFSSFLISVVAFLWAVLRKLGGESFIRNPLLVVAIVMFAVGVQFILMGLLAEMLVRTYHESQAKAIYVVREQIGFGRRGQSASKVKPDASDSEEPRPFGLCAGEFLTPADFDEPLPEDVLQEFER
ncbi:MAG TPA: glycosyltransferase family 2 protein [Pyrinomonadaceae bacterium]|nr:glycosyltransferase family 2 protein [Pyrinomonadaceae bacterium]